MSLKDRIKSESRTTSRITNKDLICRDCAYRLDDTKVYRNTSQCKVYISKPNSVYLGKGCEEYKKEG